METQLKIKSGETRLTGLYKTAFPAVARVVKRYGGGLEDAKDVFHDAILSFLEMPQEKRMQVENETAYLVTVARNDWFRRIEKMEKVRDVALIPEEEEELRVSADLYNLLVNAGKKCMDLLQAFYYERRPASEIAKLLGFSGAHSASAQKYKCLEKLRDFVKTTNRRKEDFYEN